MSKNNAPVIKASPSLSVDGSELFAPKYLSSKSSKLLAAEVAELADAVAELALAVAELADAVAELAEAVAEDAEARGGDRAHAEALGRARPVRAAGPVGRRGPQRRFPVCGAEGRRGGRCTLGARWRALRSALQWRTPRW